MKRFVFTFTLVLSFFVQGSFSNNNVDEMYQIESRARHFKLENRRHKMRSRSRTLIVYQDLLNGYYENGILTIGFDKPLEGNIAYVIVTNDEGLVVYEGNHTVTTPLDIQIPLEAMDDDEMYAIEVTSGNTIYCGIF